MNLYLFAIKIRDKLLSLMIPDSIQLELGSADRIRVRTLASFLLIVLLMGAPNILFLWSKFREQISLIPLVLFAASLLVPLVLVRTTRKRELSVNVFILGLSVYIYSIYLFYDRISSPILNWVPILVYLSMVTARERSKKILVAVQLIMAVVIVLIKFHYNEHFQIFVPPEQMDVRRTIFILLFSSASIYSITQTSLKLRLLERKEKQVIRQNSTLNDRVTATQHLAAGLAHEINNPLTIIRGNLQLVEKSITKFENSTELQDKITIALNAAARIHSIINRLSSWLQMDQKTDQDGEFDLSDMMSVILKAKQKRIDQAAILIESLVPPTILSRRFKPVEYALGELIDNAIDATVKGSERRINIKVEMNLGWCEIQIANTGPEIREKDAAIMFDPFVTTQDSGSAKGLGLTLALAIVGRLNGKLSYVRDDSFTIFSVYLPIVGQDVSKDVA